MLLTEIKLANMDRNFRKPSMSYHAIYIRNSFT